MPIPGERTIAPLDGGHCRSLDGQCKKLCRIGGADTCRREGGRCAGWKTTHRVTHCAWKLRQGRSNIEIEARRTPWRDSLRSGACVSQRKVRRSWCSRATEAEALRRVGCGRRIEIVVRQYQGSTEAACRSNRGESNGKSAARTCSERSRSATRAANLWTISTAAGAKGKIPSNVGIVPPFAPTSQLQRVTYSELQSKLCNGRSSSRRHSKF